MRQTFGCILRRPTRGDVLANLFVLVFLGLLTITPICVAQDNGAQTSIIAPELLTQVDQLLATELQPIKQDDSQGMGTLVSQAQTGNQADHHMHHHPMSDTQLNVTAIPLPNAFGMAALLLGILLLTYVIQRSRSVVA